MIYAAMAILVTPETKYLSLEGPLGAAPDLAPHG